MKSHAVTESATSGTSTRPEGVPNSIAGDLQLLQSRPVTSTPRRTAIDPINAIFLGEDQLIPLGKAYSSDPWAKHA